MFRKLFALVLCLFVAGASAAPGALAESRADADAPDQVTIAYVPGMAYAMLIVMKEQGTLERLYPHTHFDWKVLVSGAAVRDGMVADTVQVGAGAVSPFLIGWDHGFDWKILASLGELSVWLVAKEPRLRTLHDFGPNDKIGMPSPDSMSGIALRAAAARDLGNPHALDGNIVAIDYPLGVTALLNGQLAGHVASPPFAYQEAAGGGHVVFKSFDLWGPHTFNSVYMTSRFYAAHPRFAAAFYREMLKSAAFLKQHAPEAAQLLARNAGAPGETAHFRQWLARKDVIFTTTPHGFGKIARFMQSAGLISKVPASMRDIEFDTLAGVGD